MFVEQRDPFSQLVQHGGGEGATQVVRVVGDDRLHPLSHALATLELQALLVDTLPLAVLRQRQEQLQHTPPNYVTSVEPISRHNRAEVAVVLVHHRRQERGGAHSGQRRNQVTNRVLASRRHTQRPRHEGLEEEPRVLREAVGDGGLRANSPRLLFLRHQLVPVERRTVFGFRHAEEAIFFNRTHDHRRRRLGRLLLLLEHEPALRQHSDGALDRLENHDALVHGEIVSSVLLDELQHALHARLALVVQKNAHQRRELLPERVVSLHFLERQHHVENSSHVLRRRALRAQPQKRLPRVETHLVVLVREVRQRLAQEVVLLLQDGVRLWLCQVVRQELVVSVGHAWIGNDRILLGFGDERLLDETPLFGEDVNLFVHVQNRLVCGLLLFRRGHLLHFFNHFFFFSVMGFHVTNLD